MIRGLRTGALLAAATLATFSMGPAWAESSDPIKIGLHDWTGEHLTARIAGTILEKKGFKVEYVTVDYLSGLVAMESGDISFMPELWDTTAGEAMAKADASGKTERLGALGPDAREDWWYPLYMKEKCPGLPDWKALLKCGEAFSTPETAPKGRYMGMTGTWGGYDEERAEALKLPFVVVDSGTEAAMYAELQSAYERKAPIMLWVYSPHWVSSKFEGEWVQFPAYAEGCYTDPKWGVNPDKAYDCGKPTGKIWKYGVGDMKTKWPTAYAVLKAYTIDGAELNQMVGAVDLEQKPIEEVVAAWMTKHEAEWQAWGK